MPPAEHVCSRAVPSCSTAASNSDSLSENHRELKLMDTVFLILHFSYGLLCQSRPSDQDQV